jgi:hypothetical protein
LRRSSPAAEISDSGWQDGEGLRHAERDQLDTDHVDVGAFAARHWGFPPALIRVVEGHHFNAHRHESGPHPVTLLEEVVILADALSFLVREDPCFVLAPPAQRRDLLVAGDLMPPGSRFFPFASRIAALASTIELAARYFEPAAQATAESNAS